MLFIETMHSSQSVDGATRLLLLQKLQEKGLSPLIRSARHAAYELALGSRDRVSEMERAVAARTETEDAGLYIRGDVFGFDDHVLFLVFGNHDDDLAGMRAGVVFDADTFEPLRQLDEFCQQIYGALESARRNSGRDDPASQEFAPWRRNERESPAGQTRFAERYAGHDANGNGIGAQSTDRAVEALEDPEARRFLRRVIEAQADGRIADLIAGQNDDGATSSLIERLANAGLLQREVSVSCRQVGRSLFRLPSPDALAVITASNATCSECGAAIADEKVEEVIAATESAPALLADVTWLTSQLRAVLRSVHVPDSSIIGGQGASDGMVELMASVSGEPFLFLVRDSDLTLSPTHRAIDKLIETESIHLVIITTGRIHEEARIRMREYARRRSLEGSEIEILLIEGMDAAATELQHAFERVSHRALANELCELDGSLGLSLGHLVATRFRLAHKNVALTDLAASAVGALAGSLQEI